jgi:integrase
MRGVPRVPVTNGVRAAILAASPPQHRLIVETAINTCLRCGELIAVRPRHPDLIKRLLSLEKP